MCLKTNEACLSMKKILHTLQLCKLTVKLSVDCLNSQMHLVSCRAARESRISQESSARSGVFPIESPPMQEA